MDIDRNTVNFARKILKAAYSGESATDSGDLPAATSHSLWLLTAGDPMEFCNQQAPPPEVLSWLHETDLIGVHGLLVEAIYRWHELR